MEGIMSESEFYKTIDQPAIAEFKDKGSKFIAYTFPINTVDEFKAHLQNLKKEHPKAAHHCFAYRIGTDGNVFRVSDDGEPSGTAGKPILGQIDSKEVTNIAIIIVRYFGGTLLGVPGLINAYKTTSSLALQVSKIIHRQIETKYIIHFDYTQMNDIMMVLKQCNCTVINKEMQLFCNITAGIPRGRITEVLYRLNELQQVEVKKLD
ncbi:MAG: YigZ family protein [Ferruginibacter sp.]